MRTLVMAGALVLVSQTALAADLPRYDVEGYCDELADFGGGSHALFNTCVSTEQQAYRSIRARWEEVPEGTQQYCKELAEFGNSAYSMLETCVQQELSEADNRQHFSFD